MVFGHSYEAEDELVEEIQDGMDVDRSDETGDVKLNFEEGDAEMDSVPVDDKLQLDESVERTCVIFSGLCKALLQQALHDVLPLRSSCRVLRDTQWQVCW